MTSSNAAEFLLHDQYTQFPISSDRTDFLSAASTATFDALTKRKLPTVPHITDTLDPIVRQHRLLFISHTPSELAFLQRIGLKGALPNPDGSDFLSVRTSNGNPNKIDYYLHRIVQDSVRYDPRTGYVNATITVWLKNTAPTSGLPDYVIGNDDITAGILTGQPRGSNNVLMSIYSGLGHPTATIDGKAANLEVERELGTTCTRSRCSSPRVPPAWSHSTSPAPSHVRASTGWWFRCNRWSTTTAWWSSSAPTRRRRPLQAHTPRTGAWSSPSSSGATALVTVPFRAS